MASSSESTPPPSPSLSMPPAARLVPHHVPKLPKKPNPFPPSMPGFSRSAPMSPVILDSLTRPTLPSSSASMACARFPDLVKPPPVQLGMSLSATNRPNPWNRARSASAASLKSLVDHQNEPGPRLRGNGRSSTRTLSGGSAASIGIPEGTRAEDLPAIEDELNEPWAAPKWWPFSIVPPEPERVVKGKGKALDQDLVDGEGEEDARAPTRSFLGFFAGRGAVEEAMESQQAEVRSDLAEEELLDTDLGALRRITSREDPPTPPTPNPPKTAPAHSTSFLPTSMFSSTPFASPSFSFASPSFSVPPLDGPASLFASFSIPNPFAPSPSTSPAPSTFPPSSSQSLPSFTFSNPFTPSRSSSTSPQSAAPPLSRSYSSGPRTDAKDAARAPMLDEEDTAAAKIEDDSHMDKYTLIKERYDCPKYPMVFCHGLFGFDVLGPVGIKPLQLSYWIGVKEALEAIGVEVLIGKVPPLASIEERAKVLCEQIEQAFPGREVNLIGHSMGGLDARFLISRLKPTTFKVKSLTTISTPHHGSSFADFVVEDLIGSDRVSSILGSLSSFGIRAGAFDDLTTAKMARFNVETPDDPSIKYFSYGASFKAGWSDAFRLSWGIITEREGPNDGLVSVESSKWGEYRGTLTNVNHLDLVGWVGKVRYGWAELVGKPIKFKPVSFYLAIAEMLAHKDL